MNILKIIGLLLVASCSRINTQEQEVYQAKNLRHGIVPITNIDDKKYKINFKSDEESVTRGKQLYDQQCMQCHGANGEGVAQKMLPVGVGRPANLIKTVEEVENFDFYMSVSSWKGTMPGWKNPITDEQKRDIVNYIKTFRK
jgi:mono/diheme cytochrome c family protein